MHYKQEISGIQEKYVKYFLIFLAEKKSKKKNWTIIAES